MAFTCILGEIIHPVSNLTEDRRWHLYEEKKYFIEILYGLTKIVNRSFHPKPRLRFLRWDHFCPKLNAAGFPVS
jgi:hypothetical protein